MTNHPNRSKEYLCAFGNCQGRFYGIKVSANYHGDRQAFCCTEHAAAWLIRQGHEWEKDTPHILAMKQIISLKPEVPY